MSHKCKYYLSFLERIFEYKLNFCEWWVIIINVTSTAIVQWSSHSLLKCFGTFVHISNYFRSKFLEVLHSSLWGLKILLFATLSFSVFLQLLFFCNGYFLERLLDYDETFFNPQPFSITWHPLSPQSHVTRWGVTSYPMLAIPCLFPGTFPEEGSSLPMVRPVDLKLRSYMWWASFISHGAQKVEAVDMYKKTKMRNWEALLPVLSEAFFLCLGFMKSPISLKFVPV